jgi:hypothetical protein
MGLIKNKQTAPADLDSPSAAAAESPSAQTQPANAAQSVSQSTSMQEIEVIKDFNGLKVGQKLSCSKNVAEVLILKNLVK